MDLFSHPSDIAKSAIGYIAWMRRQVKPSPFRGEAVNEFMKRIIAWRRDLEWQTDVIFLFIEYLRNDSSNPQEDQPLTLNWADCDRQTISDFVNRWLPSKVKTNSIEIKAPAILRNWLIWCRKRNILEKKHFNELIQSLPKGKGEEIRRLQRAGELLFRLHSPVDKGQQHEGQNIISINCRRHPLESREGYMKVRWIGENIVYLETQEGVLIGPVLVGSDLAKTLKVGNVMFVELGRYARCWKVLRSGNVYAEGVIF